MATERIATLPAYRQVADHLQAQILGGVLSPGQQLPVEAKLADQFGVSRSTVREALRLLASLGLVLTTRGVNGGTFVHRPAPDALADSLATGIDFLAGADELSVAELLEAREVLEVAAARLAAVRRTDQQLAAMSDCLGEVKGVPLDRVFQTNRAFHNELVRAANNRLLEVMASPTFAVLQSRFLRERAPQAFWRQVRREHTTIYEAIAAGDTAAAARETAEHLSHLRTTYEAIDRRLLGRRGVREP